ncbi:BRO family protein [Rhizobium sp. L245/93]|uniref:BRO-N domain-containing protein n=2 Tax=Rhizobium TaxID=379 RepID=UPI001AD967A0|nr:BRO family protein [Rhizobium sp. L245/93]MBO9172404.1 hypothetical protein [Rhizobium sp. L245/93]
MNNETSVFGFKGHEIRTMMIDSEPWFIAGDLCAALGLPTGSGSGRWLLGHGPIQKKPVFRKSNPELFSNSKSQSATLISKDSLYKILRRSSSPEAKPLLNWIRRVVMPAIKIAQASTAAAEAVSTSTPTDDELILKVVEVMTRRVDRLSAEKAKAQAVIDLLLSCASIAE